MFTKTTASVATVKQFVRSIADITYTDGYYRRIWQDMCKADTTKRYLVFRFWNSAEADKVAKELEWYLFAMGYDNKVKRTSKASCYYSRSEGGEYVRVKAVF
jgi:hypothetical protein